jgi:hypothetical protein
VFHSKLLALNINIIPRPPNQPPHWRKSLLAGAAGGISSSNYDFLSVWLFD